MRTTTVLALVTALLAAPAGGGDRPEGRSFATRSVVHARHGLVAAAHPLAVDIGLDVLKQGGSAVDAAIAVNAALGFLEPVACGIGGDLFALVWDAKTQRLYGLNASGRAPLALTADKVPPQPDGTIPVYSPYAWTVPGAVDGWFELHAKFGRLPIKQVLAPAAARARSRGRARGPGHRRGLGARRPDEQGQARLRRGLPAGRPGTEGGRGLQEPGPGAGLRAAGRAGPRRVLQGPDRARPGGLLAAPRRLLLRGGLRPPPLRVGRAALYRLPRRAALRAAAQRPGHHGAA